MVTVVHRQGALSTHDHNLVISSYQIKFRFCALGGDQNLARAGRHALAGADARTALDDLDQCRVVLD
jgi:hypothetical protein